MPAKILIIEDNLSDVYLLQRSLRNLRPDLDLEIVPDGERALRFVQEHCAGDELQPCVILLDLHLPKVDGLEVVRAIRKASTISRVHLMVITTAVTQADEAELRRLAVDVRAKPSDLSGYETLAEELIRVCDGALAVS